MCLLLVAVDLLICYECDLIDGQVHRQRMGVDSLYRRFPAIDLVVEMLPEASERQTLLRDLGKCQNGFSFFSLM